MTWVRWPKQKMDMSVILMTAAWFTGAVILAAKDVWAKDAIRSVKEKWL